MNGRISITPPMIAPWAAMTYEYPRGAVLFAQGQELQEALHIVSGTVKLTQVDARGVASIVGLAVAGHWLGTAAIIAETTAPVTAVTCSPAVLARVRACEFAGLLRENPELSLQIHRAHARELCGQVARIGEMCTLTALRRLQGALGRFARTAGVPRHGTGLELKLPIHHWELAEFIGVTPEHLSRLLKRMETKGLILRKNGHIVIRDPRACATAPAHDAVS